MTECRSCAAMECDGATFPARRRGQPRICTDCLNEHPAYKAATPAMRRAQYRAGFDRQAASPQLDIVDLVMGRP